MSIIKKLGIIPGEYDLNYSDEDNVNIIESATGKTWTEIKKLIEEDNPCSNT